MRLVRDALVALAVGFVIAWIAAVTPQASLPRTLALGAIATAVSAGILIVIEQRYAIAARWPWRNRHLERSHPIAMGSSTILGERIVRSALRERPDLHEHLQEIKDVALRIRQGGYDRKLAWGRDEVRERHILSRHFPALVPVLDSWNGVHERWEAAESAVRRRGELLEAEMHPQVSSITPVLVDSAWVQSTGGGAGHPHSKAYIRAHDGCVEVGSIRHQTPWVVAHYDDPDDGAAIVKSITRAVDSVTGWPETKEWTSAHKQLDEAKAALRSALEDVTHTHVLRGECDYC